MNETFEMLSPSDTSSLVSHIRISFTVNKVGACLRGNCAPGLYGESLSMVYRGSFGDYSH